jgi:hypothetical protein
VSDLNPEQPAVERSVSTGPRSPQGKGRSSRNSLKHGLTGANALLPHEDRLVWDWWCECLNSELLPVGPLEELFAHRVCSAAWRLLRVERMEGGLGRETIADFVADVRGSVGDGVGGGERDRLNGRASDRLGGLAMLSRHESAIERSLAFSLRMLLASQERRRAPGPEAARVDPPGAVDPPADSSPLG